VGAAGHTHLKPRFRSAAVSITPCRHHPSGASHLSAASKFCAVVGAGPAGLAAAEVLAQSGARVTVFEHKPSPARKFLMAGRGGLNITHSEPLERFIARYGAAAQHLAPYIEAFPPEALKDFCASLGETTFVGSSGRVFPKSFKASPLLRAWLARLAALGVEIRTNQALESIEAPRRLIIRDAAGVSAPIEPDAVVLALGGASWPRLGATGSWVGMLRRHGVAIAPLAPANCGALVDWPQPFLDAFEGAPIKSLRLSFEGREAHGDVVITRRGLEGGPVYALASALREAKGDAPTLLLDLRPAMTVADLARKLSRPRGKQSQSTFLRKAAGLSKVEIALIRLACDAPLREPEALAALIKAVPLRVTGVAGLERAISTAGGVAFEALDTGLMLKALPGIFVAGEMLDFDAPTGGYLLQACFSTGVAAGAAAARCVGGA
jgi:uncharacterized flavoprotein (TIGR03862 family)